jgi:hypothetical protein
MKIESNCMRYSINLKKFAKRTQITFGAVAKGNLLPFGIYLTKAKSYLFNDYKKFSSKSLFIFELQYTY